MICYIREPVAHRQEGVQEPSEAMWSTTTARPMIQPAAPQVGIGPSSSSSSQGPLDQPVPSISPGKTQPRVQVAYLRQGVLQQLRERGYVPSAEADGGVSSMAVEQIRRYVPVDGSLGSLLHNAQGHQCAPCLFHAKRRCLRGIKCLFCHEDGHEGLLRVKQRIRPSKRTRELLRTVQERRPDLPPEDVMRLIQEHKRETSSQKK